MTGLQTLRLLVDFGLVVLIWLVQLVIYPSFREYNRQNLMKWHAIYTTRVTYVVFPLMLGQLILVSIQTFQYQSLYNLLSLIIIAILWALTFALFIPLHQQISRGTFNDVTLKKLVIFNWWRTLLWSIVGSWGLFWVLI
ncbi:MAG: hypothetical protein AAGB24_04875 [Bacteroidota bacterium]